MAVAFDKVIVHHADSLHERVADCGPDEPETLALQFSTHCSGFSGFCRNCGRIRPVVVSGASLDELPDVGIEAAMLHLRIEKCASIADG